MNSERYPPPRPLSHSTRQPEPQQQQQQQQPEHRLLPMGNSGIFKPRRQPSSSWHQTVQASKQKRNELLAEEAANKRPIGRPEKDCYGLTTWLWGHLRGIGTHEGEAVWQGEDEWEEGVGVEESACRAGLSNPAAKR
jgi:hypothetical protein